MADYTDEHARPALKEERIGRGRKGRWEEKKKKATGFSYHHYPIRAEQNCIGGKKEISKKKKEKRKAGTAVQP